MANLGKSIEDIINSADIPFEDKKKYLLEVAAQLITAESEMKKAAAELALLQEKRTVESKKVMDKYISLNSEKENIMTYNKKMMAHIADIKKKNEAILENQQAQKDEYQKRFEELMRKLEEDYNYDENKCKLVSEENIRLRAKTDKISEDITRIDAEYHENLGQLRRPTLL